MSLNGNLRLTGNFTNTKDGVDLSVPSESLSEAAVQNVDSGVIFHDTVALTANQLSQINLGDDSLSDVFGETVAMTGMTSLYVKASSSNEGVMTLSGGLYSPINTMPVLSGGEAIGLLTEVDLSTDSVLYFQNGSTSGSFDIIVTGDE